MKSQPTVAIVGATGAVGAEFIGCLERRNFPVGTLKALASARSAGKTLSFPIDSMEVKANWVEVGRLKEFNGFTGSPADAAKIYHVNSAGGKQYALVAFHIISKLVDRKSVV